MAICQMKHKSEKCRSPQHGRFVDLKGKSFSEHFTKKKKQIERDAKSKEKQDKWHICDRLRSWLRLKLNLFSSWCQFYIHLTECHTHTIYRTKSFFIFFFFCFVVSVLNINFSLVLKWQKLLLLLSRWYDELSNNN